MQVVTDVVGTGLRQGPVAVSPDAVPALLDLLADADRVGIRHCSWKSNDHLAAALAGRTDVDLLVHREDADRFRVLLAQHGCKPLTPSPGGAHPGIEHHLGMDPATGRMFHLHVHHRLVVGEHHVKNHHLPLEAQLLAGTRSVAGVRVPRPEAELAVLSVRALLKYRARDVVKDVLGIRSNGVPDEIRAEVTWLLGQTDPARVAEVLADPAVPVSADLVVSFLHTIQARPRAGLTLLELRTRLRHQLRDCRRRTRAGAQVEALRVRWVRRDRFRTDVAPRRMTPAGGGLTVALVGADGAGKSTVAAELAAWLGWKLDVRLLYLGSTQPSPSTRASYLAFRAVRRAQRELQGRLPAMAEPVASLRDTALAVHCLAVAHDRRRVHRAGMTAARRGRVVVFDRFPLSPITGVEAHRVLDGPRIGHTVAADGRVRRALRRAERRVYRRFAPPDLLIALQVPPDVAIARKPDHDVAAVTAKSAAAADLEVPSRFGPQVLSVRAERPIDEVLLAVKRGVWHAL